MALGALQGATLAVANVLLYSLSDPFCCGASIAGRTAEAAWFQEALAGFEVLK